jgi:hypothetical protein
MARKVTLLRQANGEMEEWQHASLLLSNSLVVLPNLAREHSDWINTHDRRSLKLAEALQRLRSAEHQSDQLTTESKQAVPRTMRVAQVSAQQGQGNRQKRGKHQRGKGGSDKKAKTNCANCRADGHWYAESTEKTGKPLKPELARKLAEKQGRRPPTSLVNSVRRVEVDGADGDGVRGQQGLVDGLSLCEPSSLTADEPSAAAASPIYSPTTPASDNGNDDGRVVSRAMTSYGPVPSQQSVLHKVVPLVKLRLLDKLLLPKVDTLLRRKVSVLCQRQCKHRWRILRSTSGRVVSRLYLNKTGRRRSTAWVKD